MGRSLQLLAQEESSHNAFLCHPRPRPCVRPRCGRNLPETSQATKAACFMSKDSALTTGQRRAPTQGATAHRAMRAMGAMTGVTTAVRAELTITTREKLR